MASHNDRSTGAGRFLSFDFGGVTALQVKLADLPLATKERLQPNLEAAAEILADEVRSNARSEGLDWIPDVVSVRSRFTAASAAVSVVVAGSEGPEGHEDLPRLMEFGDPAFRHPVFGDDDVWVSQEAHPFVLPAIERKGDEVREAGVAAVREALISVGLA